MHMKHLRCCLKHSMLCVVSQRMGISFQIFQNLWIIISAAFSEKKFNCVNCHEDNIFFESFRNFIILPTEDIANFLAKQHVDKISITCDKCHLQNSQKLYTEIHEFPRILMLQINRFSTSSIHHRHRKNNQNMTVYNSVKFGFVEYELFGLIDHHGVLVDNGHYTCFVYHDHCWYHCDDINIEKAILPSSS